MRPAARLTDMHTCTQHKGGPIAAGYQTVLIDKMPAAREGDAVACEGPPDAIAMGSATVLIGGVKAARVGDATAHGGVIAAGCATVFIGG
jgi:uncharacterized Zn-binding protein involved in type VI secretion